MRKYKPTIVLLLLAAVAALSFGCVRENEPAPKPGDTSRPDWAMEGYTVAETTIEDATLDLVSGIANLAKTATASRLTSSQPEVSWLVEAEADLNGRKSKIVFGINYDVRDTGSLALLLEFIPEGSKTPSTECYFYSDDDKNGTLYMAMGAQKVAIPLPNTALAGIFPIESVDSSMLSQFLSGAIYTDEAIKYEYKDETGSKRTRHYILSIDLKKTLANMLDIISKTESLKDYYSGLSFMIGSIFGIDASKISTQLPASSLKIDFIVSDGVRDGTGSGKTSFMEIDFQVAASSNKDTLFHGESFHGILTFNKLQATSKLLGTDVIPAKGDKRFDDYYEYDQRSITATGTIYYNNAPSAVYDMELQFLYDGYSAEEDKVSLMITDTESGSKKFELYYSDKRAFIAIDDAASSYAFAFDFDEFIREFEVYYNSKEQTNLLETVAYLLGSIQFYDDGRLSYKFNADFFEKILNVNMTTFHDILQRAYAAADGSGVLKTQLESAGIYLSTLIIERAFTVELDVNETFITVGDEIEIPAGVFVKQG